ncbi:MAG: hypothetical protein NVSMB23_22440 [Myxococcales bacterium]
MPPLAAAVREAELLQVLAAAGAVGLLRPGGAFAAAASGGNLAPVALRLLAEPRARAFLRVNVHEGTTWFDKERFEDLARGLEACAGLSAPQAPSAPAPPDSAPATSAAAPASRRTAKARKGGSSRGAPGGLHDARAHAGPAGVAVPAKGTSAARPAEASRPVSSQTLVDLAEGAGYRLDGLEASLQALSGGAPAGTGAR